MIHRPSRDRLAQALRQYVSGLLSNDELDAIDIDWRDRGAVAVKGMSWQLYDDNSMHYATGRHYLDKPARDSIGRWILFLHSDLEYLWPEYSFVQIVNWPMNLLTLGWWNRRKEQKFSQFSEAGDFSVWPFISKSDYELSLRHPTYLIGC